jgi:NTE family protein
MSKFIQKKTLGLALGSGGWRGQAHIGVIKALEAAGIRIDYIAGASAGAMIGGAYAANQDIKTIETAFRTQVNWRKMLQIFSDPSLHHGLFHGRQATKVFEELVGQHQIEDLKIPFIAMATDLRTAQSVKIDRGSLAEAIHISTTVPFVFSPVVRGEQLLIDGGAVTPVPAQATKEMGAQVVLAVCLYKNIFPEPKKRLGKMHTAIKTIQTLMYNLALYGMQSADLILWPELEESLRKAEPFSGFIGDNNSIAAGEKAVEKNIEQIKALLS